MPTAAQLTDQYRRDQAAIAGRAAAQMLVAFNTLLDPSALDRTFPTFLAAALQIIGGPRQAAAAVATDYYVRHRAELGITGPVTVYSAAELDLAQVTTGLLVAGPVTVKRAMMQGKTLQEAFARGLILSVNTAYRYAADGGRATIQNTTDHDPLALGYARVTDGDPCYFCAMLASRGPVYRSEASALRREDGRRYHNGCGCTAEPVYTKQQPWPGDARQYEQLWKDSTAGLRGANAIRAFRRAHEGRS